MVFVGVLDALVFPETFVLRIIVVIDLHSRPAVAFDSEMVVRLHGKSGTAHSRLEQALGKGDAGRNAAAVHFRHGSIRICGYILLIQVLGCKGEAAQKGYQKRNCLSHKSFFNGMSMTSRSLPRHVAGKISFASSKSTDKSRYLEE